MATKNSIQVGIKIRPSKDQDYWRIVDNSIQLLDSVSEPFYFDHIFNQNVGNQFIFEKMAKHIVHSSLQGFNGTIFAYGQTSSGKTYTMMGDEQNPGVMVLAAKEIFKEIEKITDRQFLLRVGYIEIYNEKIYDLFNKGNQDLKIFETSTGMVSVNCQENIITSEENLLHFLRMGNKERTVGETNMNERSSRSHAIFRIIIESRKMDNNDDAVALCVLNLVDLAGSERADQTGARGARLKEGGHINKSLLFLSNVIKRLSENEDDKYISYRDSKLTRILQASLGGNALTSIICTIKPNAVDETLSTLNFAMRAKSIKNKPKVNEIVSDATMMKRLESEIRDLKTRLAEERSRNENQIKVGQLEQHIHDRVLKIVSSYSLSNIRNKEKRRRTWCPMGTKDQITQLSQQSIPINCASTPEENYSTPNARINNVEKDENDELTSNNLNVYNKKRSVDLEREKSEHGTILKLEKSHMIVTTPPTKDSYKLMYELAENNLKELSEYYNFESKLNVEHDVDGAFRQKIAAVVQQNIEYENERLKYVAYKADMDFANNELEQYKKRCNELDNLLRESKEAKQIEYNFELNYSRLETLMFATKEASQKVQCEYEEKLAELQLKIENLEMEKREAVSLEFEFEQHRNKAKIRETDLLSAIDEKNNNIAILEQTLSKLRDQKRTSVLITNGIICTRCEELASLQAAIISMQADYDTLQSKYDTLQLDYEKLGGQCHFTQQNNNRIQQENEALQLEINNLKIRFESVQKSLLQDQELQRNYDELQKEYDILSVQLMDNVQESESLRMDLEAKVQKQIALDLELATLQSHLPFASPSELTNSLRSSGISVEHDNENTHLHTFLELSKNVRAIELEHDHNFCQTFVQAANVDIKEMPPLVLRISNIKNLIATCDKSVILDKCNIADNVEKVHLHGKLANPTFHIVEVADVSSIAQMNTISDGMKELKKKNEILQKNNEELCKERQALLESTERTINEMREHISRLSTELFEKSSFLERCTCEELQRKIDDLERERAEITLICTNSEDRVESKQTCNSIHNNDEILKQLQIDIDKYVKEVQNKTHIIEQLEMQCNDLTQRLQNADLQHRLDDKQINSLNETLKLRAKEHKHECSQFQLEFLAKLESHETEFRERLRNCNSEWNIDRQNYEEQLRALRAEINLLQSAHSSDISKEIGITIECTAKNHKLEENISFENKDSKNLQRQEELLDEQTKFKCSSNECNNQLREHGDEFLKLQIKYEDILEEKSKLLREHNECMTTVEKKDEDMNLLRLQYEEIIHEKCDLLDKHRDCANQLQKQNEDLKRIQTQYENILLENSKLLNQYDECIGQLQNQNEKLQHLQHNYEKILHENNMNQLRKEDELKYLQTLCEEALREKCKLSSEHMYLKSDYESLVQENLKLISQYNELKEQDELEHLKTKYKEIVEENSKVLTERQYYINQFQLRTDELRQTKCDCEKELEYLEKQNKKLHDEKIEMSTQCNLCTKELEALKNELGSARSLEKSLNAEKSDLRNKLRVAEDDLAQFKMKTQTDYNKLNECNKVYALEIKQLQEQVETLRHNHTVLSNALQNEREELQRTHEKYQHDRIDVEEQAEAMRQKIDSLSQQLHEAQSIALSHKNLIIECAKLQEKYTTLQQLNNAQHIDHEAVLQQLQEKIANSENLIQNERKTLQKECTDKLSQLQELKLKYNSLLTAYNNMESNKSNLESILAEKTKEERVCSACIKLKMQLEELQCNTDTLNDRLNKQLITLRMDLDTRDNTWQKEKHDMEQKITTLFDEKKSLEKQQRSLETIIQKYESELNRIQRKLTQEGSANTSIDSAASSNSPSHSRKSVDRVFGENFPLKTTNTLIYDDKLTMIQQKLSQINCSERKNRRLSTHDERRRQTCWNDTHDIGIMTEPTDKNCNCDELNVKLRECERNLFIRDSLVSTLNMQIKNHPLKVENASLMKRLQDEKARHRTEILKYKEIIAEKNNATTLVTEEQKKSFQSTRTQTESSIEYDYQKLQTKYNDLKNLCRYRYTTIRNLEEKLAQKENVCVNTIDVVQSGNSQQPNLEAKSESLENALLKLRRKYETAKQQLINKYPEN